MSSTIWVTLHIWLKGFWLKLSWPAYAWAAGVSVRELSEYGVAEPPDAFDMKLLPWVRSKPPALLPLATLCRSPVLFLSGLFKQGQSQALPAQTKAQQSSSRARKTRQNPPNLRL